MKFRKNTAVAAKPVKKAAVKAVRMAQSPSSLQFVATSCHHCGNEMKSVKREFSPHALNALISWGEFRRENIDQPICDGCYKDIRDVLIERADEILQSPLSVIASAVQARSVATGRSARR